MSQLTRQKRKKANKAMRCYEVRMACGCCTEALKFRNDAAFEAAMRAAGLTSSAAITDDAGVRHEGIDTFYGGIRA
jgi:hypothetical protein